MIEQDKQLPHFEVTGNILNLKLTLRTGSSIWAEAKALAVERLQKGQYLS